MSDKEKLATVIDANLRRLFADNVVYAREYAKYGGYSGYKDFYVPTIAKQLADKLTSDGVTVQKHGHWIMLDECANAGAYCSVCHKKVYKECYGNCKMKSAYCPHCGARMEVRND